jgi:hypothetical protein
MKILGVEWVYVASAEQKLPEKCARRVTIVISGKIGRHSFLRDAVLIKQSVFLPEAARK